MTSQSFILSFFSFPFRAWGRGLLFRDDQDMSRERIARRTIRSVSQSSLSRPVTPHQSIGLLVARYAGPRVQSWLESLSGNRRCRYMSRVLVAGNYTMLWTDTTRVAGWIQRYRTNTDMSRYLHHHPEQRSKAAHSQRSPRPHGRSRPSPEAEESLPHPRWN